MGLFLWQGDILVRGGKLAIHERCCCGIKSWAYAECPPLDIDPLVPSFSKYHSALPIGSARYDGVCGTPGSLYIGYAGRRQGGGQGEVGHGLMVDPGKFYDFIGYSNNPVQYNPDDLTGDMFHAKMSCPDQNQYPNAPVSEMSGGKYLYAYHRRGNAYVAPDSGVLMWFFADGDTRKNLVVTRDGVTVYSRNSFRGYQYFAWSTKPNEVWTCAFGGGDHHMINFENC